MRVWPARGFALLVGGNFTLAPTAADAQGVEYQQLREANRDLVRQACGECHDGSQSTAKDRALRVFDLRDEDWTARMDEKQLSKAKGRLSQASVTSQMAGKKKSRKLTVEEKASFDDFVRAELARRAPKSPEKT